MISSSLFLERAVFGFSEILGDVMHREIVDYKSRELIDYLAEKQKDRIMPFAIVFELTPLCNFRCRMCYIRLDKDQLNTSGEMLRTEEWLRIAEQARDAGVYKITFTGGEVFGHKDFRTIYETVYDMGFHISIISNGFLIDDAASDWLSKRKPDFIKITVYGADDNTYKKVCGIENGFNTVSLNIRRLRAKGISVVTCMTVIEDNSRDVEQVKNWAAGENIKLICSKVIRKKIGNARTNPETVRLPVVNQSFLEEKEIRHVADLYPAGNNSPFENCIGYHNSCIIGWNGLVKGCNFINTITTDIRDRDFVECFKELWKRLDDIKRPEKCTNCMYLRFCNPCPGKLEGESGNPEEVSEYVCDLAKWAYYNINLDKAIISVHDPAGCE